MTKLSLRKAAAVQNEIRNAIKELTLVGTVSVTEFDRAHSDTIDKRHGEAWDIINRRDSLTAVLYRIRSAVSTANQLSGISDMLATVAMIETRIKDLEIASKFTARTDIEEVTARLDKIRNIKEDRYSYGGERTVEVGLFSEGEIAGFKNTIAELKRQRQNIRDKVLEANIRSEITLSDEDSAILTTAGIL
jgi:3-deoxy-D-manno-octulosonate 8-phosphate phosphatase KdsC-like HAD superfamily phosphatase